MEEKLFKDITSYFKKGDCLVLNDTRVLPVRLFGKRKTGGKIEIFLINLSSERLEALVRPSKRVKEGEKIELENGTFVTIMGRGKIGRFVEFSAPVKEVLKDAHVPLPPYITRSDVPEDKDDYQTVYAREDGATASPTAGLHFTKELLAKIQEKRVKLAYITLHTSYGTFAPVKTENIEDHLMHAEYYQLNTQAADIINGTKALGGRVFAVGTTSTRAVEASAMGGKMVSECAGETNLFIYPGYEFNIIDGLITNFHLPCSTLLMLVSAFAGKDFVFKAYAEAVKRTFRFFSYGDAMLII